MEEQTRSSPSWRGRRAKIRVTNAAEREKRIRSAVAVRAFEISRSRASKLGNELDDWRRAEAETVIPPCHGLTVLNSRMIVTSNVSCFAEGEIEILVEPRRLTLCGRAGKTLEKSCRGPLGRPVFRVIALPVEIEPSGVTARFDHCMLEVSLPKIRMVQAAPAEPRAA